MALPVTVRPNLTDYSCRFDFGVFPLPVSADLSLQSSPCLASCPKNGASSCCAASPPALSKPSLPAQPQSSPRPLPHPATVSPQEDLSLLSLAAERLERDVPAWQLQSAIIRLQSSLVARSVAPSATADDLKGRWELVYSSLMPGGYFRQPREVCEFLGGEDGLGFSLDSCFEGLPSWVPSWRAQGRSQVTGDQAVEVQFAVQEMVVKRGTDNSGHAENRNRNWFSFKMNGHPKSYKFLYVGNEIAVAQSSAGGWSLLRRVQT